MVSTLIYSGDLTPPAQSLEQYFRSGGVSIIQAAFAHSYFIHPERVREKTVYFPNRVRQSREHYPGRGRGQYAVWPKDGRVVQLDLNHRAQSAWEKYTGQGLLRGSGYSVRHIWGNPWDPDAFTAGWNLCYMPFWAGMLTEDQHPHRELELAICQASWDLYFRNDPVCSPPDFVSDLGIDLSALLDGQPLLILARDISRSTDRSKESQVGLLKGHTSTVERVKGIRTLRRQSWRNIRKAVRELQGLEHEPFGSSNVRNTAKSCVRLICRETGLTLEQIEAILDEQGW